MDKIPETARISKYIYNHMLLSMDRITTLGLALGCLLQQQRADLCYNGAVVAKLSVEPCCMLRRKASRLSLGKCQNSPAMSIIEDAIGSVACRYSVWLHNMTAVCGKIRGLTK